MEVANESAIKKEFEPSPSASVSDTGLSPTDPLGNAEVDRNEVDRDDNEVIPQQEEVPPQEEIPLHAVPPVFPVRDFSRTVNSSSICLIRNCRENELHRIPLIIRREVLQKQNIFITRLSRTCNNHLHSEVWNDVAAYCRSTVDTFDTEQMSQMLKLLQGKNTKYMDFE